MQMIGDKVYGGSDSEIETFLKTKHSNLKVVKHDFQKKLKVWKGRRKQTGSKVFIIFVLDSGVCFFSLRDGIKDLTSFLYGVCCSFMAIDGLVDGIYKQNEEVH